MSLTGATLTVLAGCLAAAMVRLLRGPTRADRLVAADFAFLVVVAATALLGAWLGTSTLLEVVIVATLVGFLATVALARIVERGPG